MQMITVLGEGEKIMRLIDADVIEKFLDDFADSCGNHQKAVLREVKYALSKMPTVDAEPVKRGKWECVDAPVFGNPYGSYECDYCGNSMPHKTNYCPNCGAKMEN